MFDTTDVPKLPTITDIFYYVKERLLAQNKKSVSDDCNNHTCTCKYRAGENRCAAGWCIPDALYVKTMEGSYFYLEGSKSKFHAVVVYHGWAEKEGNFLRRLQSIHDSCVPQLWAEKLEALRVEKGIPLQEHMHG